MVASIASRSALAISRAERSLSAAARSAKVAASSRRVASDAGGAVPARPFRPARSKGLQQSCEEAAEFQHAEG
jgi:hypothetical protein